MRLKGSGRGVEPSRIGEPAGHDSDGWRREIMRLNKLITGNEIWTGRFMTKRVTGADGEVTKVIRLNVSRTSLGQAENLALRPTWAPRRQIYRSRRLSR